MKSQRNYGMMRFSLVWIMPIGMQMRPDSVSINCYEYQECGETTVINHYDHSWIINFCSVYISVHLYQNYVKFKY